jgi:protein-tyrosine phosphatase
MTIDFHSHILPGLDHGCRDVHTAKQQLRMAKEAGVDVVVASSHFYPHMETVENFLERRRKSWKILKDELTQDMSHIDMPHIVLGAEILICEGIEKMEGLLDLSCGGSSTLLVELPSVTWKNIYNTVEKVNQRCGGRAVIAHVERYDEAFVEKVFDMGVYGQINMESFFHLTQKKRLRRWSEKGVIAALGSDIHGTANVYKRFRKTERLLGVTFAQIMQLSEKMLFSYTRFQNSGYL